MGSHIMFGVGFIGLGGQPIMNAPVSNKADNIMTLFILIASLSN
jgi:hypothetical protein